MIRCTIDYGYDIHQIDMDEPTYLAIKNGQKVSLVGQGFVHCEEGEIDDHWYFNHPTPGEISFSLANGADFHAREFWFDPAPQSLMPPVAKRGTRRSRAKPKTQKSE